MTGVLPRGPLPPGGPRVSGGGPSGGGPPFAGDEHFKGMPCGRQRDLFPLPRPDQQRQVRSEANSFACT
eukprot:2123765-Pyramimonas_sp.AAC.1